MSNKRKEAPEDDAVEDEEKVQQLKAKRSKGKERVSFADRDQTVCAISPLALHFAFNNITTLLPCTLIPFSYLSFTHR